MSSGCAGDTRHAGISTALHQEGPCRPGGIWQHEDIANDRMTLESVVKSSKGGLLVRHLFRRSHTKEHDVPWIMDPNQNTAEPINSFKVC